MIVELKRGVSKHFMQSLESFLQLIFEFFFQFLFEGAADLVLKKTYADRTFLRVWIYFVFGGIAGAASLLIVNAHVIGNFPLRCIALLVFPVLIGFVMAKIGTLRTKRGSERYGLEFFASGWAFAFAFGAVRLIFAR